MFVNVSVKEIGTMEPTRHLLRENETKGLWVHLVRASKIHLSAITSVWMTFTVVWHRFDKPINYAGHNKPSLSVEEKHYYV